MRKMEKETYRQIYDKEPLYCKVRAHLCHQDQIADWDDLNKKYNELMSQVQCGLDLPMPDHVYVPNLIFMIRHKRIKSGSQYGKVMFTINIAFTIKMTYVCCLSRVGYQLAPEMMEFYYSRDQLIADRVRFTKESSEKWRCERITA
jgi:pyridoxamine 5'-phosphate oxidase